MKKGLLLAGLQCVLALSVAGKFAFDRATLPRAWVRTVPYDPALPLRGRYLRMFLEVDRDGPVVLSVEGDRMVARPAAPGSGLRTGSVRDTNVLSTPVVFFLPAGIRDPSRREPGEELWVEVSVPGEGLPRPVRLGVRKNGVLTPLEIP